MVPNQRTVQLGALMDMDTDPHAVTLKIPAWTIR